MKLIHKKTLSYFFLLSISLEKNYIFRYIELYETIVILYLKMKDIKLGMTSKNLKVIKDE